MKNTVGGKLYQDMQRHEARGSAQRVRTSRQTIVSDDDMPQNVDVNDVDNDDVDDINENVHDSMHDNDDDDDDVDNNVNDTDTNGVNDDNETWTPPGREEWEALQGKLKRARSQAQRLREQVQSNRSVKNSAGSSKQDERDVDVEIERWQSRAIRSDAKSNLLARGVDPELVDLALSKLKYNEVEFDDNDDPMLDDWLDEMEERYPKLFTPVTHVSTRVSRSNVPDSGSQRTGGARSGRVGRLDQGASTRAATPRPQSMSEKLIKAAHGKRA